MAQVANIKAVSQGYKVSVWVGGKYTDKYRNPVGQDKIVTS